MLKTPGETHAEPRAAELLARAGWLDVLDDVHGGICHDFNGRVASLEGLIQMLELDPDTAEQTLGYLGPEAEKLAATARLLGLLSGRVDEPPEAFDPRELAGAAVTLLGRTRELDATEVTVHPLGAPAAARACTPRVLRALLVVLASATRAARGAAVRQVRVEVEGMDDDVALRVGWADEAGREWDTASLEQAADPLAELLAMDGGDLTRVPGTATLLLPRLRRG